MLTRWALAAIVALALAWTVLTIDMPWLSGRAQVAPPDGVACPADAKPANLAFTLPDLDNRQVPLSDFAGKVVLLDFWATWCGPCKIEIPWFIEFQQKYGAAGLQVVGVSVDDTLDKLRPYVSAMKMNYVVLQGLGRNDLLDAFGPIVALPMTLLIDRDGRICMKHTGLIAKDALEQQIRSLLSGTPRPRPGA
jgi:thiol-disulfide isomerase/thioredoxin